VTTAQQRSERLLQLAGIGLWLVVASPIAAPFAGNSTAGFRGWLWLLVWLSWGAAFLVFTSLGERRQRLCRLLLLLQSGCAVAIVPLGYGGAEPGLLVAVAGQAPFVFSWRAALGLVFAQTAALSWISYLHFGGWGTLARMGGLLTFELFALAAASLAVAEARAREEAARLNAELQATQGLLAESARQSERLRISRDLHDTLGHHLTALSLNLEAASHLASGRAREHVQKAQALARLLLAEVRNVVDAARDGEHYDLKEALRTLAAGVPRPRVHLTLPEALELPDGARAHALFRCVQEIVTNAARHSGAANLWIDVRVSGEGVALQAHDDGRGRERIEPGRGLAGMRERFEAMGGRVDVRSEPGRGFSLTAQLPRAS
jgi:signal transduction histidine kinase